MSVGEIKVRLGVATVEGDGVAKLGHGLLIETRRSSRMRRFRLMTAE